MADFRHNLVHIIYDIVFMSFSDKEKQLGQKIEILPKTIFFGQDFNFLSQLPRHQN